jgi:hypothetical protein
VIAVAPAPPQHRVDVAVDRFDFPERHLLVVLVQDAGQMAHQERGKLLECRQPLPAEHEEPVGEEALRRALIGVAPELSELLLEQIGLGQPGRLRCAPPDRAAPASAAPDTLSVGYAPDHAMSVLMCGISSSRRYVSRKNHRSGRLK